MTFWRSRPNRIHVPRRGLAVGTTAAALGALVLGGTVSSVAADPVSSVQPGPSIDLAGAQSAVAARAVAETVPSGSSQLVGFAPPADPTAAGGGDPQFRLAADLPAGPLGIPGMVLKAYKLAATRVAAESPQCKLPWFLLAGIGRIESGHAGNGNVDAYGNTLTKIRGPVLDGSLAGNAVIHDSDGGRLDGDGGHDRAMGPMQFIPSTWAAWGADANGDGKADPDNIFDATYSAGRYLCAGFTDIMAGQNKVNAVLRYNHSMAYVNNVLAWAAAYSTGVMPTTPIPEMSATPDDKDKDKKDKDRDKKNGDRDKKPGESTRPSTPKSSTPPTKPSPSKPPQACLGIICLPPGIGPAPAPAPKPSPKKPAPAPAGPAKTADR
ncbi:lytic transglycosylase domain-containing protein [Gordonia sihwensis]|uniref:lytic transglycosylase domain-containing protein n=1 Tax=Gordonia TaxID=2053 RepID=UPI002417B5F6|nr:lytic transglycosylase domain-containing protein [Gordonia sihwensis]WFN94039.1 lytic transglycosylase domain-containing protein [Gordonia sihwensis]